MLLLTLLAEYGVRLAECSGGKGVVKENGGPQTSGLFYRLRTASKCPPSIIMSTENLEHLSGVRSMVLREKMREGQATSRGQGSSEIVLGPVESARLTGWVLWMADMQQSHCPQPCLQSKGSQRAENVATGKWHQTHTCKNESPLKHRLACSAACWDISGAF